MTTKSSYHRSCPICSSNSRDVVLPLAATPLGDRLSDSFEKASSLPKFALDLELCDADTCRATLAGLTGIKYDLCMRH